MKVNLTNAFMIDCYPIIGRSYPKQAFKSMGSEGGALNGGTLSASKESGFVNDHSRYERTKTDQ